MARFYYKNNIASFLSENSDAILGRLATNHEFALDEQQRNSWQTQVSLLKKWLIHITGTIVFEYSIPRMGRRVDCVLLCANVVFVIEFKVGTCIFDLSAKDQVIDYAIDLKNFHEESHDKRIVPILICTAAGRQEIDIVFGLDGVADIVECSGPELPEIIDNVLATFPSNFNYDEKWLKSIYKPTPTIIEAAQALYEGHSVEEISRSDSGRINLSKTASAIHSIIESAKSSGHKSICFLTGVPGAGKTLAGLNLANSWHNVEESEHAVFLSGNGPLVEILREALARNEVRSAKERGSKAKKSATISKAKAFIQNIHHFRDDALNSDSAPIEKVIVFDEAQRAWTLEQTAAFMKTKKGKIDFKQSEPEFLIGVMDRHLDWATIICLIGGGQEINTGEAGLQEWFASLRRSFPKWMIHVSSKLTDYEYTQGKDLFAGVSSDNIHFNDDLHLSVSVRSFRSEKVAALVKAILDHNEDQATSLYQAVRKTYPIVLTRKIEVAKNWLRERARGTERFGVVASSGAMRLKPFGFNVKAPIDPINWFLNSKDDVRSSYYLEDIATEFDIQGLELDWICVAWDADLRITGNSWDLKNFRGTSWQEVKAPEARLYLKNAYRVLLTRARQGIIVFVPQGDPNDKTRLPSFYDGTYSFLKRIGIVELV